MSKVLISSLIDEINLLLSRPVRSASRRASPDTMYQRDQLKQLRSHLESLTDDSHLGNLDKQYQALVTRLQGLNNEPLSRIEPDKIEPDLVMENSTMTNGTPESNSTFVNDRMIAALQQAIQQTLQQVVKESVQLSVQQVVSQTLAVERALMVGEISANLNKIVETQQRSQVSQELITLNQQKQKLSAEISQLESDRVTWMRQFQEFQTAQQESSDRTAVVADPVASAHDQELVTKVQEQTDRFLLNLDQMFSSTFRSLEQDIQGYQTSLANKLGHMESLEQKGEALISALVDRISQQTDLIDQQPENASENASENAVVTPQLAVVNILPELPADIPSRYLDIVTEPADENLINSLLAGNEFGEAIAPPISELNEPIPEAIDTEAIDIDIYDVDNLDEATAPVIIPVDELENISELESVSEFESISEFENISELESILGASSDTLFEDHQSALAARQLNPDFDLEAVTQIVESFDIQSDQIERSEEENKINLQPVTFPLEIVNEIAQVEPRQIESEQANDDPELLQWLEDSSNRPSINFADISPDEELMSWLGNEAIDMAKLPIQEKPQPPITTSLTSELAIFDSPQAISSPEINLDAINQESRENQTDQLFHDSISDQADDSEESLILLANPTQENSDFLEWEDSLLSELSNDLKLLDDGIGANSSISADLDQFIRNTPYALTNWETEDSQVYPTIIEVSASESNSDRSQAPTEYSEVPAIIEDANSLFIDQFADSFVDDQHSQDSQASQANEQLEIVVDIADFQTHPSAAQSNDIPEIFDNPESLFDLNEDLNEDDLQPKELANTLVTPVDDMDAIFAEVIADNAARYSQSAPFAASDELDELFLRSPELINKTAENKTAEFDTVMQGLTRDDEIDVGAETMKESSSLDQPIEAIKEELDTILQGIAQEHDWSIALEQLESAITPPIMNNKSQAVELSADEFFASLEYDKLNTFADIKTDTRDKSVPKAIADLVNLEDNQEEEEDSLLNEFADAQNLLLQSEVIDNDWDNLLNDLNSFNFNEPLLNDHREQLGLSSTAPISDASENVFDIDSSVIESHSTALIAPPPEKEVYSLDDTWMLGVDFGSTAIRASLVNTNTGRVYPLYLDDADEMPCKLVWTADQSLDDPMTADIRVLTKKAQNSGLENGEIAIAHFKQFLKIGLPYRGVSAWQPILQWSDHHQTSLRWLIAALKNLLEQIQTRANHPQLPDLGLILLKLSGVVFGYPSNWSDTYILNVREAILKAGLVSQAEQVMAVEQAIAPVLALIHDQKIPKEITLLIDAGAVTTSLCLVKGINDPNAIDRAKLHTQSFDYAGLSISQDMIVQLFYPHWQMITNPHRHLCQFDHLSLPEVATSAPAQRILLQQYLLSSDIGQQMLELSDRLKVRFSRDVGLDTWNEELMGQPIVIWRRELENLILQPFIQRLNRELNAIISNAGIFGEDVRQVLLLGNTMHIPLLSRWLAQKLANASIDPLATSIVATGLAVAPLYPNLQDVSRQQYSDYFLLQEICRLNLTQSVNPNQLLQQLQLRGINIKACRDRILTILQGDLPDGLFPWQEPEQAIILEDPTLSSELFTSRLFELETDGTYQPNVTKFQQLRVYLQAILGNMSQTLNEPLVFPEILKS